MVAEKRHRWYCTAMHNGQRDLTEGKIVRPMIAFALPLIAGNMLQTLYNAADSVIVGRFVGSGALAAVGSAYSLMTFLTSLMIGLSMGVSVAFSRLFGRKEYSFLKEAVAVSFVLIALISAAITALAWMLLPQIIRLLSVPEELSGMMGSYMYIILTGLPALFIYNFYKHTFIVLRQEVIKIGEVYNDEVLHIKAFDMRIKLAYIDVVNKKPCKIPDNLRQILSSIHTLCD